MAGADALDRARRLALASGVRQRRRGWRPRIERWLRWRLTMAIRMRELRLFGTRDAETRAAARAADCRRHRRHRAGLGHELVLRHRELGGRDVEFVGRVSDRHVARGDGARGAGAGGWPRRPSIFAVQSEGVGSGDFSFVVIGDTGEGDASQHVLRDQLLSVAEQPDVRFVVISSDVVYPTGAMKDYEAKFWLPFKGVTRPVYAFPAIDCLVASDVVYPNRRDDVTTRRNSGCRSKASPGRSMRFPAITIGTTPSKVSTPHFSRRMPLAPASTRGSNPICA